MPDILIQGRDGFFSGYRAPARSGKGPGIVLIQEIFGVNRVMREIADWLAGQNYTVVCPDLFWRQEPGIQLNEFTPTEWDRAFQLYQGFVESKGVEDIEATIKFLQKDAAATGKVGAIGYCLGGKLAYLTMARTEADCAVGYYGVGIEKNLADAGNIRKPLMLHIAKGDKFVPSEAQARIHVALDGNPRVTIHDYEGCDHAFARRGGEHYNQQAAELANGRTLGFLKRHLAAAPAPVAASPSAPAPRPAAPPRPAVAPAPAASPRPAAAPAPAVPKPPAPAPRPAPPAPKPAAPAAPAPKPAAAAPKPAAMPKAAEKPKAKAKKPKAKRASAKRGAPKRKAAKRPKGRKPAKRAAKRTSSRKRGR